MTDNSAYLWGFIAIASFIFLLSVLDGSRQGIGRKLFSLLGLMAGVLVFLKIGDAPGEWLESWLPYPMSVRRYIGAAIAGLCAFAFVTLLGILFFKKTKHREGFDRAKNAIGGAILGGVVGAITICIMMTAISISGTLSSIFLANSPELKPTEETTPEQIEQHHRAMALLRQVDKVNGAIMNLPGYDVATSLDPIPEQSYRILDKTLQVTGDEEAAKRLLLQPRIRTILEHEILQNLTKDEELVALAKSRDINGLLSHPKVRVAAEDPKFHELIEDFDLEAALDAAIEPPAQPESQQAIPEDAPYETVPYNIK